ncbi:MAG: hypothetical protein AB7C89_09205, partial [Intestinibacillus sp.]
MNKRRTYARKNRINKPPVRQGNAGALPHAFKITLIYAVFGCLWVLLSDNVMQLMWNDPATIRTVGTAKGWFYVLATSLLFFALTYKTLQSIISLKEEAETLNVELEKSNILNWFQSQGQFSDSYFKAKSYLFAKKAQTQHGRRICADRAVFIG